jgi:hypothetical protein
LDELPFVIAEEGVALEEDEGVGGEEGEEDNLLDDRYLARVDPEE